jgi:hypothetical protein
MSDEEKLDKEEGYKNMKCAKIDGYYYLSNVVKGKWGFGNLYKRIQLDPLHFMENPVGISKEIINKLRTKMILMEKIDKVSLKSLIAYVQREVPDLDIVEQIVPLLATLIRDTMQVEKQLEQLVKSSLLHETQSIKDNKYELKYESNSFVSRLITKIRNIVTLSSEEMVNPSLKPKGF